MLRGRAYLPELPQSPELGTVREAALLEAFNSCANAAPFPALGDGLSISLPKAIGAGDSVLVEVQGATNPPAGTYGGSAGNFTVSTSSDVIPVLVPSYVVSAAPAPVLASIELSSTAPGATAQYTVGDLKTVAPLVAGSSTVELKAPAGTVFPGNAADYTITDTTHGASAHPASVTGGGTDDVVLKVGANVAAGDFITVTATEVVNPGAGSYQLSLAGAMVGRPAGRPPPPSAVAISVSAGPTRWSWARPSPSRPGRHRR